jgi:hypothetical protein
VIEVEKKGTPQYKTSLRHEEHRENAFWGLNFQEISIITQLIAILDQNRAKNTEGRRSRKAIITPQ